MALALGVNPLEFVLAHDEDQSMKRNRFSEEQIIGILKERGRGFGRRSVPQTLRQRRRHLQMESEVRRAGGLRGPAAEDARGREHAVEAGCWPTPCWTMALKDLLGKKW